MRLLVCGSREWPGSWEDIAYHLPEPDPAIDVTIIHGACSRIVRGVQVSVDMLVDFAARGLSFTVERYPVDHRKDGEWPAAGIRRNVRMLRDGKPDGGLAFGALWRHVKGYKHAPSAPWKHSGTGDMVDRMLRAGLPVRWVATPGSTPILLAEMPLPPASP